MSYTAAWRYLLTYQEHNIRFKVHGDSHDTAWSNSGMVDWQNTKEPGVLCQDRDQGWKQADLVN
jgi:hypothetical protein